MLYLYKKMFAIPCLRQALPKYVNAYSPPRLVTYHVPVQMKATCLGHGKHRGSQGTATRKQHSLCI